MKMKSILLTQCVRSKKNPCKIIHPSTKTHARCSDFAQRKTKNIRSIIMGHLGGGLSHPRGSPQIIGSLNYACSVGAVAGLAPSAGAAGFAAGLGGS